MDRLEVCISDHIGDRGEQQDAAGSFGTQTRRLVVLADGMGGFPNGRETSRAVVAAFGEVWKRSHGRLHDPKALFVEAFTLADAAAKRAGGGAAVTAALVEAHGKATLAWAGDVRAYVVAHDGVSAAARVAYASDVHRLPMAKNVVTKSVGVRGGSADHVVAETELRPDWFLVLASDGTWDVPNLDMRDVAQAKPPFRAFELVTAATSIGKFVNKNPYRDNATAVVVTRMQT